MNMLSPVEVFSKPRRHAGAVISGEGDPSYRAFEILYICCLLVPLLAGFGMVMGLFANWTNYLPAAAGGTVFADAAVKTLGVLEIFLGILVAVRPRWGGWAMAAWLWLGIGSVLSAGPHGGLAICFAAISAGAVALSMLAEDFEQRVRF